MRFGQRGREGAAVAQLCSPVAAAAVVYILPFLKISCSPYLKFGCLSPRLFHAKLQQVSRRAVCWVGDQTGSCGAVCWAMTSQRSQLPHQAWQQLGCWAILI